MLMTGLLIMWDKDNQSNTIAYTLHCVLNVLNFLKQQKYKIQIHVFSNLHYKNSKNKLRMN